MKIALCVALLTLVSQTIGQRAQRSSNNYTSLRLELGKLGEDKCDALFKSFIKYGSMICSCKNGENGRNGLNGKDGRVGPPGPPGHQGSRGKRGLPGKRGPAGLEPGRTIRLGDTFELCDTYLAGTIQYNRSHGVLQLCNGKQWITLSLETKGRLKHRPGRSCRDILDSGHSHGSDIYWIDPNSGSSDDSFQAFCDMETDGGGWTHVATKKSMKARLISDRFSEKSASTLHSDAASHIHPDMNDWREVMFRFSDENSIRVVYNHKGGSPGRGKENFKNFLMGKSIDVDAEKVDGFYKFSPSVNLGGRTPVLFYYAIENLMFKSSNGLVSERFDDTDKWLNIWNEADGSNYYLYADNNDCIGMKCIAGYCAKDTPIWLMVR